MARGRRPATDFWPSELKVLRLVSRGYTNEETARRLGISERNVQEHMRHIYRKLGIADGAKGKRTRLCYDVGYRDGYAAAMEQITPL